MAQKAKEFYQLSLKDYLDTNDNFLNVNQTKDETTFETVDYAGNNDSTLRCGFSVEYKDNQEKALIRLRSYHVKYSSSSRCFVTTIGANNTNALFGPTEIRDVVDLEDVVRNIKQFIQKHNELTVGIYEYDVDGSQDCRMFRRTWDDKPPYVKSNCLLLGEFNYVNVRDADQGWLPNVHVVDKHCISSINSLVYSFDNHTILSTVNYSKHQIDPIWLFDREYEYLKLEALMKGEPLSFTMSFEFGESETLGVGVTVRIKALDGSLERADVIRFPNADNVNADKLSNLVKIFNSCLPRSSFVKYGVQAIDESLLDLKSRDVTLVGHMCLSNLNPELDYDKIWQEFKKNNKTYRVVLQRWKVTNDVKIFLSSLDRDGKEICQLATETVGSDDYKLLGFKTYELLSDNIK